MCCRWRECEAIASYMELCRILCRNQATYEGVMSHICSPSNTQTCVAVTCRRVTSHMRGVCMSHMKESCRTSNTQTCVAGVGIAGRSRCCCLVTPLFLSLPPSLTPSPSSSPSLTPSPSPSHTSEQACHEHIHVYISLTHSLSEPTRPRSRGGYYKRASVGDRKFPDVAGGCVARRRCAGSRFDGL